MVIRIDLVLCFFGQAAMVVTGGNGVCHGLLGMAVRSCWFAVDVVVGGRVHGLPVSGADIRIPTKRFVHSAVRHGPHLRANEALLAVGKLGGTRS